MDDKKNNLIDDQKQMKTVTYWGMVINIILAALKILVGFVLGSMALVADGVHSFSDLFTDAVVLITSKAAKRPPDSSHPYGHGKIETTGSVIIGLVLLIVGAGVGWSAVSSLIQHKANYPGPLVILIAFISVVSKEVLFHVTKKVAIKINSTALYANAWHHRSDAMSSLAVIVGGIVSLFGYGYSDQLAGLVVGIMVAAVAVNIVFDAFKELTEHALDESLTLQIKEILNGNEDIYQWHKLRTRKIGAQLFVDMHILVNPALSVLESHNLTINIEQKITEAIRLPMNVLIHVEPC